MGTGKAKSKELGQAKSKELGQAKNKGGKRTS
jgi:hypothetical protein